MMVKVLRMTNIPTNSATAAPTSATSLVTSSGCARRDRSAESSALVST